MKDYKTFEIPEIIHFEENPSGLTKLIISNTLAQAEIYLYGGNLTHFQPRGESPVIFGGTHCEMLRDQTLHAGIPICWPWFGPHPTDSTKPQHGFARDRLWTIKETSQLENGETNVTLSLKEDEGTLALFPHSFSLELSFTVGSTLRIALKTLNTGTATFNITQALHSYFYISDIDNVSISGVEETPFIDAAENNCKKQGDKNLLLIDKVINRVYIPSKHTCSIKDLGKQRVININKKGSHSTTIWNPGKHNALTDLPGELYRKFVCIETVNTSDDSITLTAGEAHQLIQEIKVAH